MMEILLDDEVKKSFRKFCDRIKSAIEKNKGGLNARRLRNALRPDFVNMHVDDDNSIMFSCTTGEPIVPKHNRATLIARFDPRGGRIFEEVYGVGNGEFAYLQIDVPDDVCAGGLARAGLSG